MKTASIKKTFQLKAETEKWMIRGLVNPQTESEPFEAQHTSTSEFTWVAKQCFHSSPLDASMRQKAEPQFKLWVSKVAISTASRVVSLFCFPLSPSHSRHPVEFAWRTFFVWRHLFSIFPQLLEQDFPTTLPGGPPGFRGTHKGLNDKVVPSPESLRPSTLLDLSKVSPLRLCCSGNDSFSPSPRIRVWAAVPSLSCSRFLLTSCPALLPSLALTLVIGWFLTVSLLLLSHSGASVVAVENGYPCLFFFILTQIKIPMN